MWRQWAAFIFSVAAAYLLGSTAWTIWLYRRSTHARHVPPVAAGLAGLLLADIAITWWFQLPVAVSVLRTVFCLAIIYGLHMLIAGAKARMNETKRRRDAR